MTDRPKQYGPKSGSRRKSRRKSRRGAVLVVVIVCLAVATALAVSILKTAAAARRATRTEEWRIQAAWLAESGLERAASRLASDHTYTGETWDVTAEELTAADPGLVEIEIEPIPDQPNLRRVRVRADYPNLVVRSGAEHRARRSRQAIVRIPVTSNAAELSGPAENTIPAEEEP